MGQQVKIDFTLADNITKNISNICNSMSSVNSNVKSLNADAFAQFSSQTISLNESIKSNVSSALEGYERLYSSYSSSIDLYRKASEETEKAIEEKIEVKQEEALSSIKTFYISEAKQSEISSTVGFYFNYPGNVKEVSKLSSRAVGDLLLQNGATKNGNNYLVNINGKQYGYNIETGEISVNGSSKRFFCNFFARSDASYNDITNTITILAGQGALDGKEGPIKKGNNLYEGVKTNKNSLVIVPYGTGYGHTTVFIHEGISAATRLGNFMVGGSSRKITNSIVGYSLGGMAAYRTVAQNNGLYNKLVAVNSFMQADMEKNGGSWQAFNNCEIVLLEAAGDKFVDGAIGTLKKLQRNGINMNNVHVYSNDRTMIGYSKRYLNDSNINDWSVHNSELKGWSTHNHGIEMIKSSGILNYLSS